MSNSRLSALAVRTIAIGTLSLLLSACSAVNRITQIGVTPELAPIQNPVKKPGYRSISMPMRSEERRVGKECRARGAPDH